MEIVFKEPMRHIYPVLYARTGAGVLHRALRLVEKLKSEPSTAVTLAKIAFLSELIDCLASDNENL
jgi:hypothetical protein